jgi:hypothetical protein
MWDVLDMAEALKEARRDCAGARPRRGSSVQSGRPAGRIPAGRPAGSRPAVGRAPQHKIDQGPGQGRLRLRAGVHGRSVSRQAGP